MKNVTKITLHLILFIASMSLSALGESTVAKEKPAVDSPGDAKTNAVLKLPPIRNVPKMPDLILENKKLFANLDKANGFFKKGDYKNATYEYGNALSNYGMFKDSANISKELLDKYCDTAILNLQAMLKENLQDRELIYNCLGFLYARIEKYDLALEYYKKLDKLKPTDNTPEYHIVPFYLLNNKEEKAIDILRNATKRNPTNARAWGVLAIIALHLRLFDESESAFNKALELEPQNVELLRKYTLISPSVYKTDPNITIKNLTRIICSFPKDIEAIKFRAYFYIAIKDYDAAIADINLALKVDPDNAFCLKKRSELLFKFKGEHEKPLKDLNLALEIENKDEETDEVLVCEIHDLLSEIYSKLGDEKKSLFHAKMSELIKNKSDQKKADSPEIELPDFLK